MKQSRISATQVMRTQQYNDRWSDYKSNDNILRFSRKLSIKQLKSLPLFSGFSDAFLAEISPDISIAQWRPGAIIFEEGSYVDLMFYVINGSLEATLNTLPKPSGATNRPIFTTRIQHQVSDKNSAISHQTALHQKTAAMQTGHGKTILSSADFNLQNGEAFPFGKGDVFGEIGALNGWPQSVTVSVKMESLLCQIRLPALRKMKAKSTHLKKTLDKIYRERFLTGQLLATPLFQDCDPMMIEQLKTRAELISISPGNAVVREGDSIDALYLVRSGVVKLSQKIGNGNAAVNYLSKGMTIGEVELLVEDVDRWLWTAESVAYSELIKISLADFAALIEQYPQTERRLWHNAVRRIKESGYSKKNLDQSELIQFSLEKGLVEGNSILLIDLETCVRCDDCVRGCASTHNGRPRFVREGEKFGNFLITRSCYHCEDPVCLIGCPTGAIRRANIGDIVEIDEQLCIGCSNCANKCPYDAIIMHETGETWEDNALPEYLRGSERKVASKCDLCYSSDDEPACVRNCPQGSAVRINNITEFQELMNRA